MSYNERSRKKGRKFEKEEKEREGEKRCDIGKVARKRTEERKSGAEMESDKVNETWEGGEKEKEK